MSTRTGICGNEELHRCFSICRSAKTALRYRMLKVVIKDEELALEEAREAFGSWDRDWDLMVLNSVDPNEPCFILFRLDEKSEDGSQWVLISWSPDASSVRNKMLYASTKATLRKEFGSNNIADDLYGNTGDDVSLTGYEKHKATAAAPAPLTRNEEEKKEAELTKPDVSVNSKHQTMTGLSFPFSSEALKSVKSFKDGDLDYVQLSIDINKEIVGVNSKGNVGLTELPAMVPSDAPRYHLVTFPHVFEDVFVKSHVFIYSMPGYNCSIKERMLYSSCLNSVVDDIQKMGVQVSKKLEIESGKELTEEYLFEEIHPNKVHVGKTFAKPVAPGRARRGRIRTATAGGASN